MKIKSCKRTADLVRRPQNQKPKEAAMNSNVLQRGSLKIEELDHRVGVCWFSGAADPRWQGLKKVWTHPDQSFYPREGRGLGRYIYMQKCELGFIWCNFWSTDTNRRSQINTNVDFGRFFPLVKIIDQNPKREDVFAWRVLRRGSGSVLWKSQFKQ